MINFSASLKASNISLYDVASLSSVPSLSNAVLSAVISLPNLSGLIAIFPFPGSCSSIILDTILKHTSAIVETSDDNRERLQAMELFKDTHLVKLELLSNATTIDSALNYIRSKQQQKHADSATVTSTTNG